MGTCLAYLISAGIGIVIAFWVVALTSLPRNEVIYRCDLSEISPDYPIEVRQKCREMTRKK